MFTEPPVPSVVDHSPVLEFPSAGRRGLLDQYRLEVHALNSPQRPALERFIKDSFKRTYGAEVHLFMPTLLALLDSSGTVCAAAGYRSAFNHLLYVEDYLDDPVERVLGKAAGHTIPRRAIVEIGNFSARDRRSAQALIRHLPAYLVETGRLWSVFTATRALRRLLRDLGAESMELCQARAERVIGGSKRWGHYYNADPSVMAGYLPAGLEEFTRPE